MALAAPSTEHICQNGAQQVCFAHRNGPFAEHRHTVLFGVTAPRETTALTVQHGQPWGGHLLTWC